MRLPQVVLPNGVIRQRGTVRGLHGNEWGGNSFKITGVNASNGSPNLQWVGDNNRGSTLHATYRMVENIFEELDAPGEWFYDSKGGKLYFNPPTGTDLNKANIEIAVLDELLRITGTATDKVKHLTFSNFTFTETHRTLFNKPYAGLMRGDGLSRVPVRSLSKMRRISRFRIHYSIK